MTTHANSARVALPDVLRGIAILAMVIAHAEPFLPNAPKIVEFAVGLISSLAAPLFALVMGMSAQLVWERSAGRMGRMLWRQGIKAAALIALGLWMNTWGSWVAIVLQYLGIVLLIGVPLLLLPRVTRLPIAAVLFAVAPLVFQFLRGRTLELFSQPDFDGSAPMTVVQQYVNDLFGGGSYYWPPELIAFFLVGSFLVHVRVTRAHAIVVLISATALFVPVQLLLGTGAYPTPSWVDMGRDVAVVAFAYAVTSLIVAVHPLAWLTNAVRDIGRVSLTLYLVHVLFLAAYSDNLLRLEGYSRPFETVWWGWAVTVIVIPLWGMLWWRTVGVGPVEWALNLLEGRPKHPRHAIRSARTERVERLAATAPTSE